MVDDLRKGEKETGKDLEFYSIRAKIGILYNHAVDSCFFALSSFFVAILLLFSSFRIC